MERPTSTTGGEERWTPTPRARVSPCGVPTAILRALAGGSLRAAVAGRRTSSPPPSTSEVGLEHCTPRSSPWRGPRGPAAAGLHAQRGVHHSFRRGRVRDGAERAQLPALAPAPRRLLAGRRRRRPLVERVGDVDLRARVPRGAHERGLECAPAWLRRAVGGGPDAHADGDALPDQQVSSGAQPSGGQLALPGGGGAHGPGRLRGHRRARRRRRRGDRRHRSAQPRPEHQGQPDQQRALGRPVGVPHLSGVSGGQLRRLQQRHPAAQPVPHGRAVGGRGGGPRGLRHPLPQRRLHRPHRQPGRRAPLPCRRNDRLRSLAVVVQPGRDGHLVVPTRWRGARRRAHPEGDALVPGQLPVHVEHSVRRRELPVRAALLALRLLLFPVGLRQGDGTHGARVRAGHGVLRRPGPVSGAGRS